MVQAACDSCGREWQVPESGKAYKCKDCGGRVEATVEGSDCPACGAVLPDDVRFCEECGHSLDGEREPADDTERRIANRELAKAKDSVRTIRALYYAGAFVAGISALIIGYTLTALRGHESPLQAVVLLFLAISLIQLGICLTGALRIFREPFLWSVLVASFETLRFGLILVGGLTFLIWIALWTLYILALWAAVMRIASVRRLIKRYPELWFTMTRLRKKARRRERLGKSAPDNLRRRQAAANRRNRNRLLLIGAGIVVLALGVWGAVSIASRPPEFDGVLEEFTTAWDDSRVDDLVVWFRTDRQAKARPWFRKKNRNRDWSRGLPAIQETKVLYSSETSRTVALHTLDGEVVTYWKVEDGDWIISNLKLK